jgi:hypothetical protein
VAGSHEHGNAPLGSVKCWEILEEVSDDFSRTWCNEVSYSFIY